jgi:acyl-CoA synthetase (AMP-forming)/AMP-acid ligase II
VIEMTLADYIRLNAESFSDRTAIETLDRAGEIHERVSFREAWHLVRVLAAAILDAPSGKHGPFVATMFGNNASAILSYPACWLANRSVVQINTRLADDEIRFILRDSDARVILCDTANEERARSLAEADALTVLNADTLPRDTEPEIACGEAPGAGQTAVIVYSSGTTGFPKGSIVSHELLLLWFYRQAWAFELSPDGVLLTAGPLFHFSYSLVSLIALTCGMRNRVLEAFVPPVALRELAEETTAAFLVPTMLESLVRLRACDGVPPAPAAKWILSAGAPVTTELLERCFDTFPNARIAEAYGFGEAGFVTYEVKDRANLRPHSVGWPLPGCDIALFQEDGTRCARGEVGVIGSRSVVPFGGYLGRPEESRAAIVGGGYALGGDIGTFGDDGRLSILDRTKDLIVSGGENVYTAEVERVLLLHPLVDEAAVVGAPDPYWGEIVVGAIVCSEPIGEDELRDFCRTGLAGYKVPRRFEFMPSLPRNALGKVEKRVLRDRWRAHG